MKNKLIPKHIIGGLIILGDIYNQLLSAAIMQFMWSGTHEQIELELDLGSTDQSKRRRAMGGTAQRTYLLPRNIQEQVFLNDGYIKGKEGDYGLVRKAVGDRDLPIWQTAPDVRPREGLIPIGNMSNEDAGVSPYDALLVHAGFYPSAYYVDPELKNIYVKSWDLNDYGGNGGGASSLYNRTETFLANMADKIGSPVVVTTGIQQAHEFNSDKTPITVKDVLNNGTNGNWSTNKELLGDMLDKTMAQKGLVKTNIAEPYETPDYRYTLPEVVITNK